MRQCVGCCKTAKMILVIVLQDALVKRGQIKAILYQFVQNLPFADGVGIVELSHKFEVRVLYHDGYGYADELRDRLLERVFILIIGSKPRLSGVFALNGIW